jgi:hypothetical protein
LKAANRKSTAATPSAIPIEWIRPLATPYLRGFRPKAERANGLRGYTFRCKSHDRKSEFSFFVGFLIHPGKFSYLKPSPPECMIFAAVEPIGGAQHRKQMIVTEGSLRWTSGYIRWLTHRPPRFEFFENQHTALVRHFSMREWPAEKYQHFAGNFFIETLAWLVRSGIVRRWREIADGTRA